MRHAAIPLAALAACFWGYAGPSAASAQPVPATAASIRASFQPDRLGASASLKLTVEFSGGEEGIPAPLRKAAIELPAGLGIDLRGGATCTTSRLQRSGAAGCPPESIVGRGHGLADVYAGSLKVPEEAVVTVFRGPDRDGHRTFEIFGQGETPLYQSVISTAMLMSSSAPYGSMLAISIPPIPTLMFEPDASIVSVSVTVGGGARRPIAHAAQDSILVPSSCPVGGFPFAGSFAFADGSTASAYATVPCPTR